jgi:outer membrane immunogenic protein
MRNLIVALLASAASVVSLTAAQAADVINNVPQAPAPVNDTYVPASDWSGAYLGAAGSYNWGYINNSGSAHALGIDGYGGYNWQDGSVVYGIEGNIGYSGASNTNGTIKAEQGVNGAIRGRLGMDVNPFMLYGAGGLALSNMKVSNATNSDTRGLVGWTAGLGAETRLTDNVTARIEYDYTSFGKTNFNLGGTTVSRGFDEHSVKIGIGYKF